MRDRGCTAPDTPTTTEAPRAFSVEHEFERVYSWANPRGLGDSLRTRRGVHSLTAG